MTEEEIQLTDKQLAKKIRGYLHRSKTDEDVKKYPLNKFGVYRIMGGVDDQGSCSGLLMGTRYFLSPSIVKGRFIDVLAHALRQENFYGW